MAETVQAVLGIDVGTTAIKAVVVADTGAVIAEEEAIQEVSIPRPAWAEQDPETWWKGTRSAVAAVIAGVRGRSRAVELRAVGLSGQMHSSVFLDPDGQVIRPALLWSDGRTTSQCREITDAVGLTGLRRTVGNLALEGFTAPKVLWLRENEPENFERLSTLLLPKDYIRYRLTGEVATEPSDASGTLLFDVRERMWSSEMTAALGLSEDVLPRVVESTEESGLVTGLVAGDLGIPAGMPVVGGGADNAAGAVGNGVVSEGRVQSSIGTSGAMVTPTGRAEPDEHMRLHTFCHAVPDLWYVMGVVLSAGNSLRWLRDVLLPSWDGDAYGLMTAEAKSAPPGSDGLLFLPYLSGERTPHNDTAARGVFFGLHLGHTRAHMVRVVMEGVCFALRDSLELMRSLGESFDEVRAIGGGARSRVWRQIQADVFGVPVTTLGPATGPAYGAAILAAVHAGFAGSVAEAADGWLRVESTVEPDPERVRVYDGSYERYRRLYPSLKARFTESGQGA
jgi:xylulokinase